MVDGVRALQERFMVVVTKYRTLEIEVKYMEAKVRKWTLEFSERLLLQRFFRLIYCNTEIGYLMNLGNDWAHYTALVGHVEILV